MQNLLEMKTLIEIEEAIKELSTVEARKLAGWLNGYLDDTWDRQIQTDLATGKLDKFIAKVESDIQADQVKDLDEIIDNT
ncbi:hypothetical protein [Pleurocapsa sp. CCALA 161]|uniref:hypothetical protein n=1 Tax=Pleurocapsa sp. CCALA 161 TaxID=2107688 RepID=UPI001E453552|nr:hypothetical protein [Pleurocapsa sp. CCALA 161]